MGGSNSGDARPTLCAPCVIDPRYPEPRLDWSPVHDTNIIRPSTMANSQQPISNPSKAKQTNSENRTIRHTIQNISSTISYQPLSENPPNSALPVKDVVTFSSIAKDQTKRNETRRDSNSTYLVTK